MFSLPGLSKLTKLSIFLSEHINSIFHFVSKHPLSVYVSSKSEIVVDLNFYSLLATVSILLKKSDLRFNKLSDIVVYDRPTFILRYVVSYIFSNSDRDLKFRLRFSVNSTNIVVMSISEIIKSSAWAEREAMDMFGVKFLGNSNLRRIIGDYGLWGFPGRKDFPLVGIYSYFYVINFLRVFKVRGTLNDFWSIYFQKKIYTQS